MSELPPSCAETGHVRRGASGAAEMRARHAALSTSRPCHLSAAETDRRCARAQRLTSSIPNRGAECGLRRIARHEAWLCRTTTREPPTHTSSTPLPMPPGPGLDGRLFGGAASAFSDLACRENTIANGNAATHVIVNVCPGVRVPRLPSESLSAVRRADATESVLVQCRGAAPGLGCPAGAGPGMDIARCVAVPVGRHRPHRHTARGAGGASTPRWDGFSRFHKTLVNGPLHVPKSSHTCPNLESGAGGDRRSPVDAWDGRHGARDVLRGGHQ